MARIIGIDYGAKRTGLAWTDPLQIIATGIEGVNTTALEDSLKKHAKLYAITWKLACISAKK